jgi:hypothetical protein
MASSEFMHKELQNVFKGIYEATEAPLIEKSTVDFLESYLVEQQNVV